jgi:hypothetical protein
MLDNGFDLLESDLETSQVQPAYPRSGSRRAQYTHWQETAKERDTPPEPKPTKNKFTQTHPEPPMALPVGSATSRNGYAELQYANPCCTPRPQIPAKASRARGTI